MSKNNLRKTLSRIAKQKKCKNAKYAIESTLPGFKWIISPSSINPGGFVWREVKTNNYDGIPKHR